MTSAWLPILPLLLVAGTVVIVLLAIAGKRDHLLTAGLSFVGLAAALVALLVNWSASNRQVTPLLIMDGYARLYIGMILLAALAVLLLSYHYLAGQKERCEEYYILLLLGTLGAMVLAAGNHLVSFFLGLELLSVSLYGMVAYRRGQAPGIEAGVKYLVLAGVSSGFLLFGMALLYSRVGTMEFTAISAKLENMPVGPVLLASFGLMLVGIGFKLALVPFHLWTPDVYQGAPAPVTAFLATVSKGSMFALLMRFASVLNLPQQHGPLMVVFIVIAMASMFAGNLLALFQNNIKRLLAYSSIAHLGYLLVAFLAGNALGVAAVTYYLAAYFATTLVAFGVITVLANGESEHEMLEDYRGLAWRRPWLAGAFTVALLSLGGIPLTAGFLGKFYLLAAGVGAGLWWLVLGLVISSAIGLFYYLRVLITMYQLQPAWEPEQMASSTNVAGGLTLAMLAAGIIWLGVLPMPVMSLIQHIIVQWV